MLTAKQAREASTNNRKANLKMIGGMIEQAITSAVQKGMFSVEIPGIPEEDYGLHKQDLEIRGFSVEVDNFNDGSPVKFRIGW